MEALDVDVGATSDRDEAVPELGELAWEWAGVAGEGMERRDAIDKHSDGDDGDIDRNEEAQGCSDDGGAS